MKKMVLMAAGLLLASLARADVAATGEAIAAALNERDVQANITSPDYGKFYNPIERSIGFVVSSSKP